MNTSDLLKQVSRLEIKTRRLVNEIFSGQYGSVFRGMGMEFAEVREYVAGDDIRSIDWNVTARMGHPFVKRFMAEREMTVMLVVDTSASLRFGTAEKWKSDLAAEAAAVLAFSAIRNNDKVGLCLFSERVERFVRPQKGRLHTLRLIRDLLEHEPSGKRGTAAASADVLSYLNRIVKRKAVVFLLSDFYDMDEKALAATHRRHDLIALQIVDPRELSMPDAGLISFEGAETGDEQWLDSSSATVRRAFDERHRARQHTIDSLMRRYGIDHIQLRTDRSFVLPLRAFFESRVKRLH